MTFKTNCFILTMACTYEHIQHYTGSYWNELHACMENLTVHRTRDFSERSQFCEKSFIYFMNPFEKRDAGTGIFYALIFCMFFLVVVKLAVNIQTGINIAAKLNTLWKLMIRYWIFYIFKCRRWMILTCLVEVSKSSLYMQLLKEKIL